MLPEEVNKKIKTIYFVSGSRSSLVNMEARPLTSDMLTRRCVVTRLSDLTVERFKEAVQTLGAGAMLILLPKNTSVASLEQKEVKTVKINPLPTESAACNFNKEKFALLPNPFLHESHSVWFHHTSPEPRRERRSTALSKAILVHVCCQEWKRTLQHFKNFALLDIAFMVI